MPQAKGHEPFMFIWVIQVSVSYKPACFDNSSCSKSYACIDRSCVFFGDQQSHDDYLTFVKGQTFTASRIIAVVHDYGRQKWFNDKLWILGTLSNLFVNGNFSPSFLPVVGA